MRVPLLSLLTLLIVASSSPAETAPQRRSTPKVATHNILVSVGELRTKNGNAPDIEWRKQACANIHFLANENTPEGVNVTCRSFEALNLLDTYLNQLKGNHDLHVRIIRGYRGNMRVDITNWRQKSESDFLTIGWTFRNDLFRRASKESAMNAALGNFFNFMAKEEAFKAELLVNAIKEAKTISYDAKSKSFKSRKDNKKISTEQALTMFEKESARKKNYLKSSIELGALVSAHITKVNVAGTPEGETIESLLVDSSDIASTALAPYVDVYAVNSQGLSPLSRYLLDEATSTGATWKEVSNYLGLEKGQQAFVGIKPLETFEEEVKVLVPQTKTDARQGVYFGRLTYLF